MKTNVAAVNNERTFEGGRARTPSAPEQLLRQVATCMLFEDTYYQKGSEIANQIAATCKTVPVQTIADVAIKARQDLKLRHVPLFLLAQLNERRSEEPGLLADTVERVVQRADELTELLAIVQKVTGKSVKKSLSHGLEKGLARAFRKFGPYQLAKYNRDEAIKLRDVMFLAHPKPADGGLVERVTVRNNRNAMRHRGGQGEVWTKLVDGKLEAPDTWEVALSAGADKKATWERLLREKKLGYMALLMNLRNMEEAKVDRQLVEMALLDGAEGSRALPFRFVSASKHAPSYAQALSDAMVRAISPEKLPGATYLMIDVSGSMGGPLSRKSTLCRWEAGAALGVLLREVCQYARVFTFSDGLVEIPNLRGLALIAACGKSQPHGGTYLANALQALFAQTQRSDRVIVITDEQTHDGILQPPKGTTGYIVNVADYEPALQLDGGWTRVNGFSERIVDWIRFEESVSVS